MIENGDGSQTATWRIPVPEAGRHKLYYHVFKDDELRQNDRLQGECHFRVAYDSEMEDVYINLKKANEGQEQLGTYHSSADMARVMLTDEHKLRSVTADAAKIVRR